MRVRLVLIGRGYDAAENLPDHWDVPDGASVDDVLRLIEQQYGSIPGCSPSCLIALQGRHLGTIASHASAPLHDGDELTLIAPVAGG